MCLVAYEEEQMKTIIVDDHVLIWYKNRFYRANQFAAAYALIPVAERFEVLSVANTTFQSLALSKQDVYADILSYVDDILRPLTEAKDTEGGSQPLPATRQQNPDVTRSSRPGLRFSSGAHSWLQSAGMEMTTTISGLTRSGKIGAVETKATNTGIDVGRAIAEAPRRGTSRLVDLSSSEAG